MDSIDNGRRTSSQSLEVDPTKSGPQPVLGYFDSIALIVGIVVGAGIFSFPALVAANSAGWQSFLLVWVMGGLVSLVGALCYAELASTFPSAGGDYHFLKCASRGTRIVSHAFDMGDWKPEKTETIVGRTIYFWRVPEPQKPV